MMREKSASPRSRSVARTPPSGQETSHSPQEDEPVLVARDDSPPRRAADPRKPPAQDAPGRCLIGDRCGFYGNVVLACGGCIILVALPGQSFGLGMFLDDMLQDLDMSRSEASWTWMVALLASSSGLPVAGYIFDRYGARHLLLLNILPLVLSTALVSRAAGMWSLGACFCGMRLFGPEVCELLAYCVVNMWFVENRARAASVLMMVDSSLLATPPILRGLRNAFGWRSSFEVLGLVQGVILAGCWLLLVNRPEDIGLQPDGPSKPASVAVEKGAASSGARNSVSPGNPQDDVDDEAAGEDGEARPLQEVSEEVAEEPAEDWTFKEILRERSFYMLIVCFALYRVFRAGMNMHIVNIFQEKGSNPEVASWVYSVITAGSIFGTIAFPKVSHLFENKIRLMGFVYCLGAAAMGSVGLMGRSNHWLVCWIFASLYGLFWGIVGTVSGTVFADLFGRSSLGMTRSTLGWVSTIASGVGALVFSAVREHLGSYDVAILPLAGLVGLFALGLLQMGNPQRERHLEKRPPSGGGSLYSVIGKRLSSDASEAEESAIELEAKGAP